MVTEDLGSERPIRNLIDTELDDILSEIGDLQKIHPDAYKNILEQIDQARILNNISKTIQMSVQLQMTDIYYTLASQ